MKDIHADRRLDNQEDDVPGANKGNYHEILNDVDTNRKMKEEEGSSL
jgi:hypothetical protein